MIIRTQQAVTAAVLAELQRADKPRLREIMTAAMHHRGMTLPAMPV